VWEKNLENDYEQRLVLFGGVRLQGANIATCNSKL